MTKLVTSVNILPTPYIHLLPISKMANLTPLQKEELIQQYVELQVDGMDHKDMYHFVYNVLAEDFEKLSDSELEDEIRYTFDDETLDELIDNVTNPTVLDTNNTGGKY
tara:strand:+ start:450 stop:773 length:324 start_codon:yes stop_codon:yes gene_type:complete